MQAARQIGLRLFQRLLSAGGGNGGVQLGQLDGAIGVAGSPVLVKALTVGHGGDGIDEIGRPVHAAGDEAGLRGHAGHVVVVAAVEHAGVLGGGGGGGVVGVLGNEHAALVGQGGGGGGLLGRVGPGVDVLDLHGDRGTHALGALVEGGVAGNHLSKGESGHVANDSLLGGDGALVDHLLQLHAAGHAGQVAALVDVGEGVVGVVQIVHGRGLVGTGDELDFGVVGGHLQHKGLEAVGVVDDNITSILGQLDVGVLAAGVLQDIFLVAPLHGNALLGQLGGGLLHGLHKVIGITLVVLVADANHAHLDGFTLGGGLTSAVSHRGGLPAGRGVGGALVPAVAAGGQSNRHSARQEQCKQSLFHRLSSSLIVSLNQSGPLFKTAA
ncbi:Uncharacterised protein [Flavonifractor plautii]|uniref:Uncharacterized protein n=1 Tax=Flavonifractor plautii TaxID=292800 RepID=A0A174TJN7_FLAPL|nr:Uncharacterised protein [Flavonifractor plautii]